MKTLFILHEPICLDSYSNYHKIPDNSEIIIPFIGSEPLEKCYYDLCYDALVAQKRYEFFILGKNLNIKKITNLNLGEDNINYEKLMIQLQLYIKLNNIVQVLYEPSTEELENIYKNICNKYKIKIDNMNFLI